MKRATLLNGETGNQKWTAGELAKTAAESGWQGGRGEKKGFSKHSRGGVEEARRR